METLKSKFYLKLAGREDIFTSTKTKISVKRYSLVLEPWKGHSVKDSYGNKQLINYKGKPFFAELAVLKMLSKQGWKGVWVDTYRKRFLVDLPENKKQARLNSKAEKVLKDITKENGKFSGCWDVFLWKGRDIKFFELKRKFKDAIRANQMKWLSSAINIGYSASQFSIIEWNLDAH